MHCEKRKYTVTFHLNGGKDVQPLREKGKVQEKEYKGKEINERKPNKWIGEYTENIIPEIDRTYMQRCVREKKK